MKRAEIKVGMTLALCRPTSRWLGDRKPQKVIVVDMIVPGKYDWSPTAGMNVEVTSFGVFAWQCTKGLHRGGYRR